MLRENLMLAASAFRDLVSAEFRHERDGEKIAIAIVGDFALQLYGVNCSVEQLEIAACVEEAAEANRDPDRYFGIKYDYEERLQKIAKLVFEKTGVPVHVVFDGALARSLVSLWARPSFN